MTWSCYIVLYYHSKNRQQIVNHYTKIKPQILLFILNIHIDTFSTNVFYVYQGKNLGKILQDLTDFKSSIFKVRSNICIQ